MASLEEQAAALERQAEGLREENLAKDPGWSVDWLRAQRVALPPGM